MSKEVTAVELFQPDIPFTVTFVFGVGYTYEIYHDPIELNVSLVDVDKARQRIIDFDVSLKGGV